MSRFQAGDTILSYSNNTCLVVSKIVGITAYWPGFMYELETIYSERPSMTGPSGWDVDYADQQAMLVTDMPSSEWAKLRLNGRLSAEAYIQVLNLLNE